MVAELILSHRVNSWVRCASGNVYSRKDEPERFLVRIEKDRERVFSRRETRIFGEKEYRKDYGTTLKASVGGDN